MTLVRFNPEGRFNVVRVRKVEIGDHVYEKLQIWGGDDYPDVVREVGQVHEISVFGRDYTLHINSSRYELDADDEILRLENVE